MVATAKPRRGTHTYPYSAHNSRRPARSGEVQGARDGGKLDGWRTHLFRPHVGQSHPLVSCRCRQPWREHSWSSPRRCAVAQWPRILTCEQQQYTRAVSIHNSTWRTMHGRQERPYARILSISASPIQAHRLSSYHALHVDRARCGICRCAVIGVSMAHARPQRAQPHPASARAHRRPCLKRPSFTGGGPLSPLWETGLGDRGTREGRPEAPGWAAPPQPTWKPCF